MAAYRLQSPAGLSGGQKQLIAIAAVLACRPSALIFDEALSQLDDETTQKIKQVINTLKSRGTSIVMVEHDSDNLDIADRIFAFEGGRLSEVGHG